MDSMNHRFWAILVLVAFSGHLAACYSRIPVKPSELEKFERKESSGPERDSSDGERVFFERPDGTIESFHRANCSVVVETEPPFTVPSPTLR